jgi:dCMP deaminase
MKTKYDNPDFISSGLSRYDKFRITRDESGSFYLYTGESVHFTEKEKRMDNIYLNMAKSWGENSHCSRAQVGCLIVKNKSIISDGYNGSPTGFPNICEDSSGLTLPWVLHAEANAITKLAKSTQSSDDSTLYVTLSPCYECSKLIIQSGVKRLVFTELYRKLDSLPFLVTGGIEIVKL